MKITLETTEFKSALEKAVKFLPEKPIIENLGCVKITGANGTPELFATNLEQEAVISMTPLVFPDFSEDILICEPKSLLKTIKLFDYYETIIETNTTSSLTIRCGNKKIEQRAMPADEYPNPKTLTGTITDEAVYDAGRLKKRFNAVKYAAANDKNVKPIMMGIHMNGCDMVCIDGHRIAMNTDETLNMTTPITVPLPGMKLVTDTAEGLINIKSNGKHLEITGEKIKITTSLFDGDYFDYRRTIEASLDGMCVEQTAIDTSDFIKNLNFLISTAEGPKFQIHWYKNELGTNTSKNRCVAEIKTCSPKSEEICFNGKYMLEAITQVGETAEIKSRPGCFNSLLLTSDTGDTAFVLPQNAGYKMFEKSAAA